MNILQKLFKPLKNHKAGKYKDLSKDSQKVDSAPPSDLLILARDMAGKQIQENMAILNDCKWVRMEYTYPAFDNMNFMYKNKIFSVVIDICDTEGKSYLPEEYKKRQLYAAKQYNLIPCKFPVVVPNPEEPDLSLVEVKSKGWNLLNTETDEIVVPEHLGTIDKTEMSDWEIRHYGIRFVIKYLKSKKMKVVAFQDTLEVDPQIWFQNQDGQKSWVLVRCARNNELKNADKPKQIKEIIRRCFKNDGYFAGVNIISGNDDKKIYRGDSLKINFKGFEKIHSTL